MIHDTRTPATTTGKTTLWDRIAIAVRAKGYSLSTERTYVHWAKRFVAWHGKRHPSTMGAAEVQAHLDHQPENCSDDNLAAMCQRHHLAHDHEHHQRNAQATRRAKSGTLELFS